VTLIKMARFLLQVQPKLTMSRRRRLSLSYQWITSWNEVTKISRPSKCQTCLCTNSIGDQMYNSTYFVTC